MADILTTDQEEAIRVTVLRKIDEIFSGDQYRVFLHFALPFTRLTLTNIVLLYMQNSSATTVCGMGAWKAQGGTVKGKALMILCPERNGNTIMYGPRPVYDISQVEGVKAPVKPRYDRDFLCTVLTEKLRTEKKTIVNFSKSAGSLIQTGQSYIYPDMPSEDKMVTLLSLYLQPDADAENAILQSTISSSIDYLVRLFLDLPLNVEFPYLNTEEIKNNQRNVLEVSLRQARLLLDDIDRQDRERKKTEKNKESEERDL